MSLELDVRNSYSRREHASHEVVQSPLGVQRHSALGPARKSKHPAVRREERVEVPSRTEVPETLCSDARETRLDGHDCGLLRERRIQVWR